MHVSECITRYRQTQPPSDYRQGLVVQSIAKDMVPDVKTCNPLWMVTVLDFRVVKQESSDAGHGTT